MCASLFAFGFFSKLNVEVYALYIFVSKRFRASGTLSVADGQILFDAWRTKHVEASCDHCVLLSVIAYRTYQQFLCVRERVKYY